MSAPSAYLAASTESSRFVNFASVGPLTARSKAGLHDHIDVLSLPDRPLVDPLLDRWLDARTLGARLLGTEPDHLSFVGSTSHGLFATAFGLRPGGNVVVPANEFPANVYPWLRADGLGLLELRKVPVPDGRVTPGALAEAVDADTRAIAISAVGFLTGYRADIAAMRELAGDALLIVDAVQALGALRIDLDPADMVVAGSQKWMRCGIGSGMVAVSDRYLERFVPNLTGWNGVDDMFGPRPAPHDMAPGADCLSIGSPPMLMAGAWRGAFDLLLESGIDAIESAVLDVGEATEAALTMPGVELLLGGLDRNERSSIVSFRTPGADHLRLVERLKAEGFVFTARDGSDVIRLSPHASTPVETADAIGAVVAGFLAESGR